MLTPLARTPGREGFKNTHLFTYIFASSSSILFFLEITGKGGSSKWEWLIQISVEGWTHKVGTNNIGNIVIFLLGTVRKVGTFIQLNFFLRYA